MIFWNNQAQNKLEIYSTSYTHPKLIPANLTTNQSLWGWKKVGSELNGQKKCKKASNVWIGKE
jgi:hypothetical protein